jgi:hypothetical protein
MTKICLSMIVRDEASVIARCLASVRPHVDRWAIIDTGSTDDTAEVIRTALEGLPGRLHRSPWVGFAENRNEALALAAEHGDYVLTIDADDVLDCPAGLPELTEDSYSVRHVDVATGTTYTNPLLVRSGLPWRWEGVRHEFLACEQAGPATLLEGVRILRHHDGARRRNPGTFSGDAEAIEAALLTETRPFMQSRYRFYLAQSYRDANEPALAVQNYLERARLGFWQEEVFVSLVSAAVLQERLGEPAETVLASWAAAIAAGPHRAEALHGAARTCRIIGRAAEGCELALRGLAIPMPAEGLFVEPWVYEWGLLDEFGVNAFRAGHFRACVESCLRILARQDLPADERTRVAQNATEALAKL